MSEASLATRETEVTAALGPQAIGIVMPLGSQKGGAEALLQHFLRHGRHRFKYVCAFLEEGPLVDEVHALGYDTTVFPITHLSHLTNYLKTLRSLRLWIKQKRLQMVISWMPKAHMYVSPAALFTPARAVWFQHGVPYGHPIDRLIALFPANGVICCSKTSKRGQDQMFPRRQTHVCYPGVALSPVEAKSKDEARDRLRLPKTTPVVGMVARLEHWKGAHIFVEAAAAILKHFPEATLFIVGGKHPFDLAYSEKVYAMVEQLNCGQRLILAGQRPITEVPLWQAAADVIVHPVVGVEPFGMSVVEAMGQGKVVVASDAGGPSEVIEDGVNGVLIRGGEPDLLASTVIQLLENPAGCVAIGKQALLRAHRFSVEMFAARFDEVIGKLLLA
jgi:glycosyltransferase involved in cell wall biosynthesis